LNFIKNYILFIKNKQKYKEVNSIFCQELLKTMNTHNLQQKDL